MKNKVTDTDYIKITAQIRSLERSLLSNVRREHMLEARSDEGALKVLLECGYGEMSASKPNDLGRALADGQRKLFAFLESAAPDPGLIDVFRIKYDYHNLKAFIKSEALSLDPTALMLDFGRVSPGPLVDMLRRDEIKRLPPKMGAAVWETRGALARAGDPRRSDMILDRVYFEEIREIASASQSSFLLGYVKLIVSITNIRTIVRASLIGLGSDFLREALIPDDRMSAKDLIEIADSDSPLSEHYSDHLLEEAAEAGTHATRGEISISDFERQADNACIKYLKAAKLVAFGEQPLIAYIAAREADIVSIRIIMSGRRSGIPREQIRERLRETYV